jgi:ribosomal protein L9
MDAQLNCETCGATFHQYNLKQKYCSATCRAKGVYANRKHQLAKAQQLPSITEQLARSEERVKQLEAQLKDRKEESEALRATIEQVTAQLTASTSSTPSRYHIELRKMSITQVLDQPYSDYYLDHRGNKTISTDSIYLSSYARNGALLSEQEIKGNDELLYLMERHNITDIELSAGL